MLKIIRNIKELQKIENEWNDLSKSSLNENVFLSYDWNYLWAKHFLGNADNLFIIAVYNDASGLEAIAPFFLKRFFLFFKSMMFISGDYSDYLDIIVRKDADKEKIYSEIFIEIIKNKYSDIIHLKQVSGGLLNGIKKNASETPRLSLNYKESGDCYYFNLPDNIDNYMKRFNSKQRYNILSRVEKAEKNNIKFIASSSIDKPLFTEYLNYFFDLHQKRWNEKGKRGVFYNKNIKSFFTDLFTVLFSKNRVTLSFLVINEDGKDGGNGNKKKIISSAVCFDCGGKRQVYLPGFDTKYSSYHPGIVLTYYIIEEAIAEKYEEFDFLKGGEEYKQRFGAVKRENYKLYLYKNKIVYYIYKINLFIEKEIKEKLKDLVFKI
ncbi:MAG: GNAT family N-acetyltransferase [Deltaproteobacteria bacterium]|jgi:CelD/BcsL family acetyltransferase involved in cellulose biosynthesis|nr:GNAT family N-acetyltransferase [Deltaproteobacteria bacterium]